MTDARPEITAQDRPDRDRNTGRFQLGNPGRPKGARHAALLALDAIGAGNAAEVMQAVVEAAKGGDMRAADILLSRLWPARKGRAVVLDMPTIAAASDVTAALGAVVAEMAAGNLSPDEASAVAGVIEIQRRAIETDELERRITALEDKGTAA